MAVTKYTVYDFDSTKAQQGALVAMVSTSVDIKAGGEVSTEEWTGDGENPLKGVGICRTKDYKFLLTLDSVIYTFNDKGEAEVADTVGYKLMLATTQDKASTAGSVVGTDSRTVITRGSGGEIIGTDTTDGASSVSIESLNARDQFAIQALKTLMERGDKDPSTLSDNEMSFYCETAYQWAANMMTQASKVRATVENEKKDDGGDEGGDDEGGSTTRAATVSEEDMTTVDQKLLNNIVAALERTDEEETDDKKNKIYSERVSIPKLIDWLNEYTKHTAEDEDDKQKTVGLDDLVKAVKQLAEGSSSEITIKEMPAVSLGNEGLGRDKDHPIWITGGGGFPSRQVLAAAFTADKIHDLLTFNEAGAVGYSTLAEAKKALQGWIANYSSIDSLWNGDGSYAGLLSKVDNRVKSWLQAAKVNVGGTDYRITVNTPT